MHDKYKEGIAREKERRQITGVSTSQWYLLQREGQAPMPVPLGLRTVGWLRWELWEWNAAQAAERARP